MGLEWNIVQSIPKRDPRVSAIVTEVQRTILVALTISQPKPMRSRTLGVSPMFIVLLCSLVVVVSSLGQHL